MEFFQLGPGEQRDVHHRTATGAGEVAVLRVVGAVTGGTAVTGTAMGDLSGYTLTLTATETTLPNFVTGATAADPFAGLASATDTIVVGSNS